MVQRTNAARDGPESVGVMKGEVDSSILSGSTTQIFTDSCPFFSLTDYFAELRDVREVPKTEVTGSVREKLALSNAWWVEAVHSGKADDTQP